MGAAALVAAALVVAVASTEAAWAALATAAYTVALSLEDFTVLAPAPSFEDPTMAASMALAPVPSFEDFMAMTTGTTTATGPMAIGTTTLTIRTTIPTTTTAVATLFSDGCTPRMACVCNPARYAVDRP